MKQFCEKFQMNHTCVILGIREYLYLTWNLWLVSLDDTYSFGIIHLLSMTTSKAPSVESSVSSSSKTIDRVLDFLWFERDFASFYNATLPEHNLPVVSLKVNWIAMDHIYTDLWSILSSLSLNTTGVVGDEVDLSCPGLVYHVEELTPGPPWFSHIFILSNHCTQRI